MLFMRKEKLEWMQRCVPENRCYASGITVSEHTCLKCFSPQSLGFGRKGFAALSTNVATCLRKRNRASEYLKKQQVLFHTSDEDWGSVLSAESVSISFLPNRPQIRVVPLPAWPSTPACPKHVKADNETERKGRSLLYNHHGKMQSFLESFSYTRSFVFWLFFFLVFYSQRTLVNNSHAVAN